MAAIPQSWRSGTRHARIHEKTHACSGGQRVMLLLVEEFTRKFQCRPDIIQRDAILALHFFECHAARQAAYYD